jgi:hypothetical protein
MRSWLWLVLVLLCCVLGLVTEPLTAQVATLGPATAFPTSLGWNDTADEDESPWSSRSPDGWAFQQLLTPRIPRSPRDPLAASSLFSPLQAGALRRPLPEFSPHAASLSSAFSPLRC